MGGTESISRAGNQVGAVLGAVHIGRPATGDGITGMMSGPHVHITPATATRQPDKLRLTATAPLTDHFLDSRRALPRDLAATLPMHWPSSLST